MNLRSNSILVINLDVEAVVKEMVCLHALKAALLVDHEVAVTLVVVALENEDFVLQILLFQLPDLHLSELFRIILCYLVLFKLRNGLAHGAFLLSCGGLSFWGVFKLVGDLI